MSDVDLITKHCGRCNTDIMSGWEAGILGKVRVGRKLFDRHPPGHLLLDQYRSRFNDWMLGRDAAYRYKQIFDANRFVVFGYKDKDDNIKDVTRKGWKVSRSSVISQLARQGVSGAVHVYYYDYNDTEQPLKRTVECGI